SCQRRHTSHGGCCTIPPATIPIGKTRPYGFRVTCHTSHGFSLRAVWSLPHSFQLRGSVTACTYPASAFRVYVGRCILCRGPESLRFPLNALRRIVVSPNSDSTRANHWHVSYRDSMRSQGRN